LTKLPSKLILSYRTDEHIKKEVVMTSDTSPVGVLRDSVRTGVREVTAVWGWFLALGIFWVGYGTFVLSYRVGSLAAVATLVGTAFLVGGVTQLAVATRIQSWRWLFVLGGIVGIAAGIGTFAWPGITLYVVSVFVAWYLVVFGVMHLVGALSGPKVAYWWTTLALGIAELVLGAWALRSWQQSLLTLVTLVGAWAICHGVSEIFAAFTLRDAGKRAQQLVG